MEKTNINSAEKYLIEKYPGEGIYENTDDFLNQEVVFVVKNSIWIIGPECIPLIEEKQKPESSISESLHLKTIAILSGKSNELDLNKD